jgi:hypothetical protein
MLVKRNEGRKREKKKSAELTKTGFSHKAIVILSIYSFYWTILQCELLALVGNTHTHTHTRTISLSLSLSLPQIKSTFCDDVKTFIKYYLGNFALKKEYWVFLFLSDQFVRLLAISSK